MRAKSRTVPFQALAASRQLINWGGMVRRLSLCETTGANPAQIKLFDGSGTGGILLDNITLNANQSTRDYFRWDEYPVVGGLYADIVSGSIDLVVVITPADECDDWGEPVIVVGQLDLTVVGGAGT